MDGGEKVGPSAFRPVGEGDRPGESTSGMPKVSVKDEFTAAAAAGRVVGVSEIQTRLEGLVAELKANAPLRQGMRSDASIYWDLIHIKEHMNQALEASMGLIPGVIFEVSKYLPSGVASFIAAIAPPPPEEFTRKLAEGFSLLEARELESRLKRVKLPGWGKKADSDDLKPTPSPSSVSLSSSGESEAGAVADQEESISSYLSDYAQELMYEGALRATDKELGRRDPEGYLSAQKKLHEKYANEMYDLDKTVPPLREPEEGSGVELSVFAQALTENDIASMVETLNPADELIEKMENAGYEIYEEGATGGTLEEAMADFNSTARLYLDRLKTFGQSAAAAKDVAQTLRLMASRIENNFARQAKYDAP